MSALMKLAANGCSVHELIRAHWIRGHCGPSIRPGLIDKAKAAVGAAMS
jgi:hypothetical protein